MFNWWDIYYFSNENEFESWEKKVKDKIKSYYKLSEEETLREFILFDLQHGIPQTYLFKKEQTLF